MSKVSKIKLSSDAYHVCLQHAHTTDEEEVMGLLVGRYTQTEEVTEAAPAEMCCVVSHAVILRRSDKRKDRVEISPEMLIQAQQKAEDISGQSGVNVNIVGWYHSHPKMTVVPSVVDLRTQAGYQQMDSRFVGVIFSVFNFSEANMAGSVVTGGFQAVEEGGGRYRRRNVPVVVTAATHIDTHNQEALCSLSNILQQEQLDVLQRSRVLHAEQPLHHLHNSAVTVQRVVGLIDQVAAPLSSLLDARVRSITASKNNLDAEVIRFEALEKQYLQQMQEAQREAQLQAEVAAKEKDEVEAIECEQMKEKLETSVKVVQSGMENKLRNCVDIDEDKVQTSEKLDKNEKIPSLIKVDIDEILEASMECEKNERNDHMQESKSSAPTTDRKDSQVLENTVEEKIEEKNEESCKKAVFQNGNEDCSFVAECEHVSDKKQRKPTNDKENKQNCDKTKSSKSTELKEQSSNKQKEQTLDININIGEQTTKVIGKSDEKSKKAINQEKRNSLQFGDNATITRTECPDEEMQVE